MSSIGYRQAELERQRKEQLRLQQLQNRARGLLTTCENTIRAVNDPAVQQMVARDLRGIQRELAEASRQIKPAPEQAIRALEKTRKQLNKVITNAETTIKKWSQQQAQAKAKLESARQSLEAEKQSGSKGGEQALARAEQELSQATSFYRERRYEEMTSACDRVSELIEQAGQESFDESVRREVVKGLLSTLTNMGFAVEPPRLQGDDPATGVVTLSGQMPSGKTARFEVNLDGRMSFDFDGYEGRACAKDLEKIDQTLQEQFAVKLSGSQTTWKNPDKIAKGARNLPSGSRNKAGH